MIILYTLVHKLTNIQGKYMLIRTEQFLVVNQGIKEYYVHYLTIQIINIYEFSLILQMNDKMYSFMNLRISTYHPDGGTSFIYLFVDETKVN